MVDTNMAMALEFARALGPVSELPQSLRDVVRRAEFVRQIDGPFISGSSPVDWILSIAKRLKDVAEVSQSYIPDVPDGLQRVNIALRLWSGCISAAKTIALGTMDGPNTPEARATAFSGIDALARTDPIYLAGVEAAPILKKARHEPYSFEGVPRESPVRAYPSDLSLLGGSQVR